MLVYIAILTLVSGGALTLLFSMGDQINQGRAERLIANSAQTAMERMLSEIRTADLVDIYYSTLETSPGELTLTQGSSTAAFSVSSSTLYYSQDGVVISKLTPEQTTVDSLIFYHYVNTNTELVRIVMTLSASIGDTDITRTFDTATVLRGSYD